MEAIRYQRSVIKTGWIEGHADGRAEGKAEGLLEGKAESQRQIAINLKKQGIPSEVIAQCTGLSIEDISALSD